MRTQKRVCTTYLVNYCQFIVSLTVCGVPERWLNGGEVFVGCFFLKECLVFFFIFWSLVWLFIEIFFVEGSILAQDERWRRA